MISIRFLCVLAFSGAGFNSTFSQDTPDPRPTAVPVRPLARPRPPVATPSVAPLEEPVPLENKNQNESNGRGNGRIIGTGQFGILKNVKDRLIPGDNLLRNSKGRFRKLLNNMKN